VITNSPAAAVERMDLLPGNEPEKKGEKGECDEKCSDNESTEGSQRNRRRLADRTPSSPTSISASPFLPVVSIRVGEQDNALLFPPGGAVSARGDATSMVITNNVSDGQHTRSCGHSESTRSMSKRRRALCGTAKLLT